MNSKTVYILIFIGLNLHVRRISGFDPATCIQCRESHVCNPPDCFCCRDQMPMETHNIPQMVFFSFDDAVTPQVAAYYRQLFESSRKNPNGCPISMTLFISDKNTVYDLVREFYDKGMEIASHSVTHSHPSSVTFHQEAKKQKENLAKYAGIPEAKIVGWRSPFLEPLGDIQPSVLKELGYEYDATLTLVRNHNDTAITPFTLDFGWPYDCKIKPCPSLSHNGFWEVPVVSVKDYLNKYDCVYVDGCNNPPPSEKMAFKFLQENFNKYYKTNRAPMGINMHASWFYYPERKAAMNRFIKELVKMDDVYIISIKQVIEWLKNPTPLHLAKDFPPWQCRSDNSTITNAVEVVFRRHHQDIQNSLEEKRRMERLRDTNTQQTNIGFKQNTILQQQNVVPKKATLEHTLNPSQQIVHHSKEVPRQQSWRQRQEILLQSQMSITVPPLVPNLPIIRFWWNAPEIQIPQIQIQRDTSIGQDQRRREIKHRQKIEEERQHPTETKRQVDLRATALQQQNEHQSSQSQLTRKIEQKRLLESKRSKYDDKIHQEVLHQSEIKMLHEAEQRKELPIKPEELRNKKQEKTDLQNTVKTQQENERQKQPQHQNHTELKVSQQSQDRFTENEKVQKAFPMSKSPMLAGDVHFLHNISRTENESLRQNTSSKARLQLRMPTIDDTRLQNRISIILDKIMQFRQKERVNHLETLSFAELKSMQQEIKRRLVVKPGKNVSSVQLMQHMPYNNDIKNSTTVTKENYVKDIIIVKDIKPNANKASIERSSKTKISTENEMKKNKQINTSSSYSKTNLIPVNESLYLNAVNTRSNMLLAYPKQTNEFLTTIIPVTPTAQTSVYDTIDKMVTPPLPVKNVTLQINARISNISMWNVADIDTVQVPWRQWLGNTNINMQLKDTASAVTPFQHEQVQKTVNGIAFNAFQTMTNSKYILSKESSHLTLFASKSLNNEPFKHIVSADLRPKVLNASADNVVVTNTTVPAKIKYSIDIPGMVDFVPANNSQFINIFSDISLPKKNPTKPMAALVTEAILTALPKTSATETTTIGKFLTSTKSTTETSSTSMSSPSMIQKSQSFTRDTPTYMEITTAAETPITGSTTVPFTVTSTIFTTSSLKLPKASKQITLSSNVSNFTLSQLIEHGPTNLLSANNAVVSQAIAQFTNPRQHISLSTKEVSIRNLPTTTSSTTTITTKKMLGLAQRNTVSPDRPNLSHLSVSPTRQESKNFLETQCIQEVNCMMPNCVCRSETIPYGLKLKDIPQIVYITVDGSLNFHSYSKLTSLFRPTRRNPNGCRIKGTVFATDSGSNYRMSQALHNDGIEIGLMGFSSRPYENAANLLRDIQKQRERIAIESHFSKSGVTGWRSPGFKTVGDEQYEILSNNSLYDSSLTAERSAEETKLWPHTLDFGWNEPCNSEDCPKEVHPGVWEIPVIPYVGPENTTTCEYADGCTRQPKSGEETMQYLMKNFNYYYKTNKAPFGVRLKQIWFHWFYREQLSALVKFLDKILTFGDVYVISVASVIEWMKTPTPLEHINHFKPWMC